MSDIDFRIGNGFDLHRLVEGIPLILGGVRIDAPFGSLGHSDGDVITHAVIDAILGAAALGDIGVHFPPSDESLKGADSIKMLEQSMEKVAESGFCIVNVDITVVLEKPKLSHLYPEMRENLAAALLVDSSRVSIKAKTAEKLGPIGESKAVAAYAVALVRASADGSRS